jgi:hypothetical protein
MSLKSSDDSPHINLCVGVNGPLRNPLVPLIRTFPLTTLIVIHRMLDGGVHNLTDGKYKPRPESVDASN